MGRTRLMAAVYHAPARRGSPATSPSLRHQAVEALLEPTGVRALGAGQRLEPLGDLLEALLARGLREARVHLRVLVGLAGDRGLEVLHAVTDRRRDLRVHADEPGLRED